MKYLLSTVFTASTMLLSFIGSAQEDLSDYLYAVLHDSPSTYDLVRIDVNDNGLEYLAELPFSMLWSFYSMSANEDENLLYLSLGNEMLVYDAENGQLVDEIDYDIEDGANAMFVIYNKCDGLLYSIISDDQGTGDFVTIDPETGTVNVISEISLQDGVVTGEPPMMDPSEELFMYRSAFHLIGLNLYTGEEVFATTVENIGDEESFGHMSYDCEKKMIIGTSADIFNEEKSLAQMDPYVGIVQEIGSDTWDMGFWKPWGGGNCINQETGVYYYSGDPSVIVGAETGDGSLEYSNEFDLDNFFMLTHFSSCGCTSVSIEESASAGFEMFPNPINGEGQLSIVLNNFNPGAFNLIQIWDASGRLVLKRPLNAPQISITMEGLAAGVYAVAINKQRELLLITDS